MTDMLILSVSFAFVCFGFMCVCAGLYGLRTAETYRAEVSLKALDALSDDDV